MAKDNLLILILIGLGIYLVASGSLGNLFGGQQGTTVITTPSGPAKCPSDLKTTVTLNTKDGLATTATNANVSYYVFKSDGAFYKSGTTSAGTASFDVQCGGSYKLLTYDDDGTAPDYYPEEVAFMADAGEGSLKTINMDLNKESITVKINDFRDPVDLNQNISAAAGSTVSWEIIWSVNQSNAAIKNPIMEIEVNNTCVDDISVSGYSEITGPSRETPSVTEGKLYYFKKTGIVDSSDGLQSVSGTVLFDSSTACRTTASSPDYLTLQILDEQEYADPDYATVGYSAFHIDAENQNNDADVGMADSNTAKLYMAG